MKTVSVTEYEMSLLIEALERAASRRNSMSKVTLAEKKTQEHTETAREMYKLIERLQKAKAA